MTARSPLDRISDHPHFAGSQLDAMLAARPIGFVDIGARGGVHPLVEPLARRIAVLGFEPDEEECRRVTAESEAAPRFAHEQLMPIGLWRTVESARTLYRLAASTNDSLLPPKAGPSKRYEMARWDQIGDCTVPVSTLDEVLFGTLGGEGDWGDIVKLDTQGTEADILEGARRTLDERCVAVLAEVSFLELYEGQSLFSDLERQLRERGFAFYGFGRTYHRSGKRLDKRSSWGRERLIQADAVFFKDPLAGGFALPRELDVRDLAVLFSAALLLEYFDFAIEIAHYAFPPAEATRLEQLVRSEAELDIERTHEEVRQFAAQVDRDPAAANLLAGAFVDARRERNDVYDAMANLDVAGRNE